MPIRTFGLERVLLTARVVSPTCFVLGALALVFPQGAGRSEPQANVPATALVEAAGNAPQSARANLSTEADALLVRWAPLFFQHTSPSHPERDRPLRIDFDGDWDSTDNWQHLGESAREADVAIYGSAILTEIHAYLTYTLFYPRDWTSWCVPYVCHDNDLETALLVVDRAAPGRLVLVETKTHNAFLPARGTEIATAPAGEPMIEVESGGHGMHALERTGTPNGPLVLLEPPASPELRGDPTIAAPDHSADIAGAARYTLLSLHDTLWERRNPTAERGRLWMEGETGWLAYSGQRLGRIGRPLGASMATHDYPGGVRPPWALREFGQRGDWFLDPAFNMLSRHAAWLDAKALASERYVYNPYLDDLRAECSQGRCPALASSSGPFSRGGAGGFLLVLGLASWSWRRRDG